MAKVAIVVGSESDLPYIAAAEEVLKKNQTPYEIKVLSAHRKPDETAEFSRKAEILWLERGQPQSPEAQAQARPDCPDAKPPQEEPPSHLEQWAEDKDTRLFQRKTFSKR